MNTKSRVSTRTVIIVSVSAVLLVVLVLAILIILGVSSNSKASNLTAVFSELVGNVEVQKSSKDQYSPVNNGFLMTTAMQLQTKTDSRVRLDLSTGSIVRVGQTTIFSLNSQQSTSAGPLSQIELQAGRIWVVLNGGSLDVNTPDGVASVRGSYVFVWEMPSTHIMTTCCLEGLCQFKNLAGIINLTSGQKVISSDPNILPTIEKMDQSDAQLWLDNVPEAASIVPQVASLLASSTPTPSGEVPSDTPALTATPTPTSTPANTATQSIPMVTVSVDTNLRSGPGTIYDILGAFTTTDTAEVVGRNAVGDYWVIRLPSNPNINYWLWGQYATVTGDPSNLPIIATPPTPTPTPTQTPTVTPTDTKYIRPSSTPSDTPTEYFG